MIISKDLALERLKTYQALLEKSGWEPKVLHIVPLDPKERERLVHQLQVAYIQHRMVRSRGDL